MGNFPLPSPQFPYIENARRFALERPGNDRILKQGDQYRVEAMPELSGQQNLIPNLIDLPSSKLETELKPYLTPGGSASAVVEFVFDSWGDGDKTPDRRLGVQGDQIKEAQYTLHTASDALRSPEDKALAILRDAIQPHGKNQLLKLTPRMIDALLKSQQLTPDEKTFVTQTLDSPQARSAQTYFATFFSQDEALNAAQVRDFDTLIQRLNDPTHQSNLNTLTEIARFPDSFKNKFEDRGDELAGLANTLKELPGFRRMPHSVGSGIPAGDIKKIQQSYDFALRTIKQYDYKVQVTHGMQFNKAGISAHDTQIDYRHEGQIFSLGFSGQNFDFNSGWQPGVGYVNQADAAQRIRFGYRSGSFDMKLGVARDTQGHLFFERPQSESLDRYIARKGDDAQDWAKQNPWITAGIVSAAAGGAYAYSLANPDQDLALDFNQRFDLLDREFIRVRGEITPEVHLKGGSLDLGVRRVGLGASGQFRDHSYDASLRQNLTETTLRKGEITNQDTDLNLRYGYRSHSISMDHRYTYSSSQLDSRLAYQKNFVHSASFDTYVSPYVNLQNGTYTNSGVSAGLSKNFGDFQMQLNVDYNQTGGASGGFRFVKQFGK